MSKKRAVSYALVLLAWVYVIATVWRAPLTQQGDFKTYYTATVLYESGGNPYDIAKIREASGYKRLLGFYYPLSTLYLVRPFGHISYVNAHRLWLALKVLALVALLFVWKRYFLANVDGVLLLVVALLGFQAATVWDIKSGNITIFEQMWIWIGLALLIRGKTTEFVVCVVLASIAKLFPLAFLLLLFHPAWRSRANTLRAVAGVVTLAGVTALGFLPAPQLFDDFVRGLTRQQPPFHVNPSIMGIADEMGRHTATEFLANGWGKLVLIGVYYALLLAASWKLLARTIASRNMLEIVWVAALFYALVVPRLVIYSCMIAIVPVLALLLPSVRTSKVGEYGLAAALCVSAFGVLPGALGQILSDATPLLLLWASWLAVVSLNRRDQLHALGP